MSNPLPELNRRYSRTCFRLETLQDYAGVSGEERARVAAWLRGQRHFRSLHDEDGYLRRAAQHALEGKRRARVHVVSFPLSDYVRYELDAYRENVAVGEAVGIANQRDIPDPVGPDFWLFDGGTANAEAVIMHYDPATAELLELEHLTAASAPARLEDLNRQAEIATQAAQPLDRFVSIFTEVESTPRAS